MNCSKCPHDREITIALEPCQQCGRASGAANGGDGAACLACPRLKEIKKALHPCQSCDEAHVRNRVQATEITLAQRKMSDHAPTEGVTGLPPETEDALRKLCAVIFDFTPVELLLIQHAVHGRNVTTFRKTLADLKIKLDAHYDLSEGSTTFRAIAHIWKNRIVEKCPPLGDLFVAVAGMRD